MARYRKKPVVIEATQFFYEQKPWPEGVYDGGKGFAQIDTLEGPLAVSQRDWIITGIKGERYPCKPDIFDETYEPVTDERTNGEETKSN